MTLLSPRRKVSNERFSLARIFRNISVPVGQFQINWTRSHPVCDESMKRYRERLDVRTMMANRLEVDGNVPGAGGSPSRHGDLGCGELVEAVQSRQENEHRGGSAVRCRASVNAAEQSASSRDCHGTDPSCTALHTTNH